MDDRNCRRNAICPGLLVDIVLKKDQPTGILTRGEVLEVLTNKAYHPRGIKVMLMYGKVSQEIFVKLTAAPLFRNFTVCSLGVNLS